MCLHKARDQSVTPTRHKRFAGTARPHRFLRTPPRGLLSKPPGPPPRNPSHGRASDLSLPLGSYSRFVSSLSPSPSRCGSSQPGVRTGGPAFEQEEASRTPPTSGPGTGGSGSAPLRLRLAAAAPGIPIRFPKGGRPPRSPHLPTCPTIPAVARRPIPSHYLRGGSRKSIMFESSSIIMWGVIRTSRGTKAGEISDPAASAPTSPPEPCAGFRLLGPAPVDEGGPLGGRRAVRRPPVRGTSRAEVEWLGG